MKTNARIIMVGARTIVSIQSAATFVLAEKDFYYSETSTVAKKVRPFMMSFWVLTRVYHPTASGETYFNKVHIYILLRKQWTPTIY